MVVRGEEDHVGSEYEEERMRAPQMSSRKQARSHSGNKEKVCVYVHSMCECICYVSVHCTSV